MNRRLDLEVSVIQEAQRGDTEALRLLIEKTQDRLYRFCLYLSTDPQLAQDLCQDTYVKVLENIRTVSDPSALLSWLLRSAKNHYLDYIRTRHGDQESAIQDLPEAVLPSETPAYESILEIREVLARLPMDDRTILLLVDLEEYSYAEAADIIEISESAARSRLHRARQAFIAKLKKSETK